MAHCDLERLRSEIERRTASASANVLADARLLRDKLREKQRKAARQRRRLREAAQRELRLAHVRARGLPDRALALQTRTRTNIPARAHPGARAIAPARMRRKIVSSGRK